MRILLLVSSFNALTQRVWCHLRDDGHEVGVELAPSYDDPAALTRAIEDAAPDLILCTFLIHRVPESVWQRWDTVIIHPGPVGDRGPSSLEHAILTGTDRWGVTALSAVEKMDAGPVWATAGFDLPSDPISKSALYFGRVADAALTCIDQVVRMAAAGEQPTPVETWPREVPHTGWLPRLGKEAFRLDWARPAVELARQVAAADGAPGATAAIDGHDFCLYDATATEQDSGAAPGSVVGHDAEAVAVACGRGTLWIGYAAAVGERRGPKLPAGRIIDAADTPGMDRPVAAAETSYERTGNIGYLTLRSYNGAMDTEQCRRLTAAVEKALVEDTQVLVIRGTEHEFSSGMHLGVINAAADPAAAAWENIRALMELCTAIVSADQVTVAALTANSGAGGVMLALCTDVTVARGGVVLNPYYSQGISGAELHTWRLPARVGSTRATELLQDRLPISSTQALRIGLVDDVGPRDPEEFDGWLAKVAEHRARQASYDTMLAERAARELPASFYAALELAEVARDIFENRHGFAERRAFTTNVPPLRSNAT